MPDIPHWLSWLDIALSFIAFILGVLAMPTILESIFGQPRVVMDFDKLDGDGGDIFRCCIHNARITNRLLRKLRVRRRLAEDVFAIFSVYESGTLRPVHINVVPLHITPWGPATSAIQLPGGSSTSLSIVEWEDQTRQVTVSTQHGSGPVLPHGEYEVRVDARTSGGVQVARHKLVVGPTRPACYWQILPN